MRYRRLGDSELRVSEVALGSFLTYSGGVSQEETVACIEAAFDAGINFFDTSNSYGRGAAETAWGEILGRFPRSSFILATKVFFPMSDEDSGLSAAQVEKQLEASLRRLRVDYVDLYYCHRYDTLTPIEETLGALDAAVTKGKVRYLGLSEWTPEQIRAATSVCGTSRFVASQPQYSILWRGPEVEVFPICAARGISQVAWAPLAEGVLTGKYAPGEPPPADSRAASSAMNWFIDEWLTDPVLRAVRRLFPIAEAAQLTPAQLALAWVLRRPEVAAAVVGATRPEQVRENAAASGTTLPSDVIDAVDRTTADVAIKEPRLARGASDGVLTRGRG
jgi:aryl-alcohol dehydrogenase-like predicted oxidoreductase